MAKRLTIDDSIGAILSRDEGMPYQEVMRTFEITPNQFVRAVSDIGFLIKMTEGNGREVLEAIAHDQKRKRELFNMGEDFVKEQYERIRGRILGEKQGKFYDGTFLHLENVEAIIYYALESNNPELLSAKRNEVIECIKKLPCNLQKYFHGIGLNGLMVSALPEGKQNSPLAVLEIFDIAYQKKTGDKSLFDLKQKEHIHKWGDNFHAGMFYWKNPENVEEAIYHTLTENNPQMSSHNRTEVIECIKKLPSALETYLFNLKFRGLMMNAFTKEKRNSPLAVLEVFDKIYQQKTGDKSLFDLKQKEHLHRWKHTPKAYWKKPENVEEAVYHTLTENNPRLKSNIREEIISEIKNFPSNIVKYFYKLDFTGLMGSAFPKGKKGSPLEVLKVFDRVYQQKTGDKSLFYLAQKRYLKVGPRNRLIRE